MVKYLEVYTFGSTNKPFQVFFNISLLSEDQTVSTEQEKSLKERSYASKDLCCS